MTSVVTLAPVLVALVNASTVANREGSAVRRALPTFGKTAEEHCLIAGIARAYRPRKTRSASPALWPKASHHADAPASIQLAIKQAGLGRRWQ